MPPARWTHTALHSWLVPHAMVRTIHGLGYPFQAHSPFFWSYTLSIIQEQCHDICIYIISIPCSGDYQTQATMCAIFHEFALLCSYSAFSCFASSCLSFWAWILSEILSTINMIVLSSIYPAPNIANKSIVLSW